MKYLIIAGYIIVAIILKIKWGATRRTDLAPIIQNPSGQFLWAILWPVYVVLFIIVMIVLSCTRK